MFFADTEPDRTCNLFHRSLAFELQRWVICKIFVSIHFGLGGSSDPEVLGDLLMGKSIAVRGEQNLIGWGKKHQNKQKEKQQHQQQQQ